VLSSAAGMLAFGGDATAQHLAWFDRAGRPLGGLENFANLHNPVFSPDEKHLVGDNNGIWIVDLERGAPTKIAQGTLPIWSSDGSGVVFTSRRVQGATDLLLRPIMGQGNDELLVLRSREMKLSGDWSPLDKSFVYVTSDPATRLDIFVLPPQGEARPFLNTPSNEMQPRLSPDGKWIAYTSDESGSWEVYVQSFPNGGAKRAVSVGGGAEPHWTKAGREIVYLTPDGRMMSADIEIGAQALEPGRPKALFHVPLNGDITLYRNHYAVTNDGQRFLVDTADESTREPITVVVNWDALVGR
jgi:Tol biopolymer transport system component